MNRIINDINSLLKQILTNPVVSTVVQLFLVLYAGLAVPKLSGYLKVVFDNCVIRVVIISIVAILNNYNPVLALSASIVFILTLQTLSLAFNNDKLKNSVDEANDNVTVNDIQNVVEDSEVNSNSNNDPSLINNDNDNNNNNENHSSFVGVNDVGDYKSLENDFGFPYDGNNDLTNNDY